MIVKHRLQNAFDKIHTEQELKNCTMEFLAKATNGYNKRKTVSARRWIAAAACFAMFLLVGMGYSAYLIPAFAISIDVNPSMELGINRFNKVVSVDTFNEDGYAVMSDIDVYNLNYKDALETILADRDMKEYIVQNQFIAVTVFGENEAKNNELLVNVSDCTSSYANVHCSWGYSKEIAAAHEAGMSCGKYRAFLQLQALDPAITEEDMQGLTMCQIWDMIDGLTEGGNIDRTEDGTGRCGRGQHSGHGHGRGRGMCQQEGGGE